MSDKKVRRSSVGNSKTRRLVRKFTASKLELEAKDNAASVDEGSSAEVERVVTVTSKAELESKESPAGGSDRTLSRKTMKIIKKAEAEEKN